MQPSKPGLVTRPGAMQYGWPFDAWESWYAKKIMVIGNVPVFGGYFHPAYPVAGISAGYYPWPAGKQSDNCVPRLLPVMPIPWAALANALLWSTPFFALFSYRSWSRASRARRGLCIKCAYPLDSALTACPECGTPRPAPTPLTPARLPSGPPA